MTELTIFANSDKKRLKVAGTVAAGEHVFVTVKGGGAWTGLGKALRLRVLFADKTLAKFPYWTSANSDDWPEGTSADVWLTANTGADATCELNLNTIQAEKYLRFGGRTLWVLDDAENHTLYGAGEVDIESWPKMRGADTPYDLDEYPDIIAELKERVTDAEDAITDAVSGANALVGAVTAAVGDAQTAASNAASAFAQAMAAKAAAESASSSATDAASAAEAARDAINTPTDDFTEAGTAVDAKAVGDALAEHAALISDLDDELTDHVADSDNPHNVTAEQVGLGNVTNTSDEDKPVSTAQQAYIENAVGIEEARALEAELALSTTKADKSTTLAGYGITDAKISNGTITLGSNTIKPLTSHQDITGKADLVNGKVPVSQLPDVGGKFLVVQSLPSASEADPKAIYLVPKSQGTTNNVYDEYLVVEASGGTKAWEKIGSTELSGNIELDDYVQKVDGKGLSTNDYTDAEKTKLSGIEAGAQVNTVTSVNTKTGAVVLGASDVGAIGNTGDQNLNGSLSFWNGNLAFSFEDAVLDPVILLWNGLFRISFPSQSGALALLADIYAAVQQIAPAWVSGTTYNATAKVSYNGVVYARKTSGSITSSTNPASDTTNWEAKKVSELFLGNSGNQTLDGTLEIMSSGPSIPMRIEAGRIVLDNDSVGRATIDIPYKFNTSDTLALLSDIPNVPVKAVKVDGVALTPDAYGAVDITGLAPLASPAFTGTPTAPTPTSGDNSTKVATTAFVQATVAGSGGGGGGGNLDYCLRVDPETGGIYYTTPDNA